MNNKEKNNISIAISGSSGFVAQHLIAALQKEGYKIICINREVLSEGNNHLLCKKLTDCDVVINLAGATINQRWTTQRKAIIKGSRIESTKSLVTAINSLTSKPSLFISASAVGIYESGITADESATRFGSDFMSEICQAWEAEAKHVSSDVRLVIPRLGVVLAKNGGAFPQLIKPFNYFVGGRIGNGTQGFSWIHIDDLIAAFVLFIEDCRLSGIVNLTAPQITDNSMLTHTLGRILERPAWLTVPNFLLHLLLGERASIITTGAKVYPGVLFRTGFQFQYPTLDYAIKNLAQ